MILEVNKIYENLRKAIDIVDDKDRKNFLIKNNLPLFPKSIFKYRDLSDLRTFDLLKEKYFYCSSAKQNKERDPSEFRFDEEIVALFRDKNKKNKFIANEIINYLKGHNDVLENVTNKIDIKKIPCLIESSEPYIFNPDKTILKNHIGIETKNFKLSNQEINSIEKAIRIYWIAFKPLLEKMEGIIEKNINKFNDTWRLCSFSPSNDVDNNWEDYSLNYSGICIEYDVEEILKSETANILPVVYKEKKTNAYDFYGGIIKEAFRHVFFNEKMNINDYVYLYIEMFFTKYKKYEMENELRVIVTDDTQKFYIDFIKAVYLGKNVTEKNKKEVLSVAQSNHFNVYLMKEKEEIEFELIYDSKL